MALLANNAKMRACLGLVLILFCASACMDQVEDTALLEQGRQAFIDGRYIAAEKHFEEYLRDRPQGVFRYEAWSRLLDVIQNIRDDKPKAAGILEAMHLEFGEEPGMTWKILPRLAQVYESMREWDKASDTWNKVLSLPEVNPEKEVEIHRRLARIYQRQGQYDLALDSLETCQAVAQSDTDKAFCQYDHGLILSFLQSFDRAAEALQSVRELSGASSDIKAQAGFLLAELLEEQGKISEAIALFEDILKTYPNPRVVEKRLEFLRNNS